MPLPTAHANREKFRADMAARGRVVGEIRTVDDAAGLPQASQPRIGLPVRSKPCEHLGKALQPHSEWTDAAGNRTHQMCRTYRACGKHGICMCKSPPAGVANCQTCPDYHADDDSVESFIVDPQAAIPESAVRRADVRQAHIALWKKKLAEMPDYPGGREGAGVLYVGGGKYDFGLYLSIRLLREVGCQLPVQIWHRGSAEPVSNKVRGLPGVTVVDLEAHPLRASWRTVGGWQAKMIAGLHCGWKKWIFSDADNYPVSDPTPLIDILDRTPAILWPDIEHGDNAIDWKAIGMERPFGPGTNGGSAAYNAETAWKALQLAHHFDMHSDYYYRVLYGDQDAVRAAFHGANVPFSVIGDRPRHSHGVFVQSGPDDNPMWVHRIKGKPAVGTEFGPKQAMRRRFDLPMEARVWAILKEYKAI